MQIDSRTMGQLIQLQMMNNIDLQGTAVQSASGDSDGSLFDILLQEMMMSEAQNSGEAGLEDLLSPSNIGLSDTMDSSMWQVMQNSVAPMTSTVPVNSVSTGKVDGPGDMEAIISRASQKYGVPESLIKAVIETESSFNPNAVSSAGAKGLMQLMDGTARGLGISDPFDPEQNIDGGTRYLSYQLQRFGGQENMALAAYNAGPTRVASLGIKNDGELMEKLHLLPRETQNYIAKIASARSKYGI